MPRLPSNLSSGGENERGGSLKFRRWEFLLFGKEAKHDCYAKTMRSKEVTRAVSGAEST